MSSHVDKKVNDKFLEWLNRKCGLHTEVTSTRGEEHKHLGMKFAFRESDFIVNFTRKAKETLDEFAIKFKENKSSEIMMPAAQDMFDKATGENLGTEQ